MTYGGTVLSVADIHASRKFYEDLFGLELYQDYGINICFTGGLSLQQEFDWLVNLPKDRICTRPHNMELYFEEKNFDNFMEKLKGFPSVRLLGGVVEHGWGQRVIRLYDPDGHLIEVGECMKTVIRRFLNTGLTMKETAERMDVSVKDLETLLSEEYGAV